MRTPLLLALALASTGCHTLSCSNASVPAVEVTLLSSEPGEIVAPSVTWSGSGFVDEPCDPDPDDPNLWRCGADQDGPIIVTATSESHEPGDIEADVPLDAEGCHPDTVTLSLTLEPQFG